MTPAREAACPLCGAPGPFERVADVRKRRHCLCGRCGLIFVETEFLPSPEAERERYAKHQCGLENAGYVAFLRQAVDPGQTRGAGRALRIARTGIDAGADIGAVVIAAARAMIAAAAVALEVAADSIRRPVALAGPGRAGGRRR